MHYSVLKNLNVCYFDICHFILYYYTLNMSVSLKTLEKSYSHISGSPDSPSLYRRISNISISKFSTAFVPKRHIRSFGLLLSIAVPLYHCLYRILNLSLMQNTKWEKLLRHSWELDKFFKSNDKLGSHKESGEIARSYYDSWIESCARNASSLSVVYNTWKRLGVSVSWKREKQEINIINFLGQT